MTGPASDSSHVLTIGDEHFPVAKRTAVDVKCLANEAHQMYLVETRAAGNFHVCDDCSLSTRIEAPAEEPTE